MNQNTAIPLIAIILILNVVAAVLLYYNTDTPFSTGNATQEQSTVSISNIEKTVSEYTLMKDFDGGLATRECGSQITATYTLTNPENNDTTVNITLTVKGEQIQTQQHLVKANSQTNGSIESTYPKCRLPEDTINLTVKSENT